MAEKDRLIQTSKPASEVLEMLSTFVIGLFAGSAWGQSAAPVTAEHSQAAHTFQVATIKPSQPEETRLLQVRGNRIATTGTSVIDLLKYAYGLHEQEIFGGPKWIATQKFDIMADPETEVRPTTDQFKAMMQSLLADRFHLAAHRETRDISGFELMPAKNGTKLTKSKMPPDGLPSYGYAAGRLNVTNATMTDFANYLQRFVTDRPVFDLTGLTGRYDLDLKWTPDDQADANRQNDSKSDSVPGLFTAIQEQLGLRLQEGKRPAQVFVIDQVEMPSEN